MNLAEITCNAPGAHGLQDDLDVAVRSSSGTSRRPRAGPRRGLPRLAQPGGPPGRADGLNRRCGLRVCGTASEHCSWSSAMALPRRVSANATASIASSLTLPGVSPTSRRPRKVTVLSSSGLNGMLHIASICRFWRPYSSAGPVSPVGPSIDTAWDSYAECGGPGSRGARRISLRRRSVTGQLLPPTHAARDAVDNRRHRKAPECLRPAFGSKMLWVGKHHGVAARQCLSIQSSPTTRAGPSPGLKARGRSSCNASRSPPSGTRGGSADGNVSVRRRRENRY
jgi:hypothetical protein